MSIREYARSKEVSDTTIRKARGTRLSEKCFGVNPKNNRPFVYKELADVDWLNNHDPAYHRTTQGDKKKLGIDQVPEKNSTVETTQGEYAKQKAKREDIEYQLAALRLLEKQGTLVQKSKVYDVLYSFGANIRSHLQDIPDLHLDNILAAGASGDRDGAYSIMAAAIDQALVSLTSIDAGVHI